MAERTLIRERDMVQLIKGSGSGRVKDGDDGTRPVGTRGRVKQVLQGEGKAIVEGMHTVRKALRPNPKKGHRGGIVDKEAAVPLSNLMLVCRACDKPVRVKRDRSGDKLKRVCAKCGEEI